MVVKRLRTIWIRVGDSFWFIPSLIILSLVALAFGAVIAEGWIGESVAEAWPRVFGAGASGSRGLLEAIAASMITVAGVVFSITLVALSLTSSQYTPRVLRNFMRDRGNQTVLGVFVGIFAYCLVVLRTIRGGEHPFVPSLAVLIAMLLGFVGIGFLIFFIHHIAQSIQAVEILSRVHHETRATVSRQFGDPAGPGDDENGSSLDLEGPGRRWHPVYSEETGYIQQVDLAALRACALRLRTMLRMERGVGDFTIEDTPLVSVLGVDEADDDLVRSVREAYVVGPQRTVQEDPSYGIRQLVDIALKGLSPGINDTTTAMMSVDYLTAILLQACDRKISAPLRDDDGEVCVITRGPSFEGLVQAAYDQVRRNAEHNVTVLDRLLSGIEMLTERTRLPGRREVLLRQAEALREAIDRTIEAPVDRVPLLGKAGRVVQALQR